MRQERLVLAMSPLGRRPLLVVIRTGDGAVVAARVGVANRPWSRMRGLLGRRSLDPGAGLLIEPCSSVHTFGMAFAVDVVFLRADGTVARVVGALRPGRIASFRGARSVLELPSGHARAVGLAAGDVLRVEAGGG